MAIGSRRLITAVLVVAVVIAGGYAGFGYNPAPSEPPDTPYQLDGPFEMAQATGANSFVVTEELYTGEGTTADSRFYRIRYTYNGSALRLQVVWGDGAIRQDVYLTPEREYTRVAYDNESEFQERLSQLSEDELVSVNESAQVFYTADNRSERSFSEVWDVSLLGASLLSVAPVEQVGTTTYQNREATVYAPTTGWTRVEGRNNSQSLYVSSASGRILVDPDTGSVYRINTTFTWERADSWGEAFLREPGTTRHRYRVRLNASPGTVAPEWLDRVRNRTQDRQ
ncbi:MAG: hypothetical protein ABEH90_07495 [Halolamina sp.]